MRHQNILVKSRLSSGPLMYDYIRNLAFIVICRLLMDAVYQLSISPFFDYAKMINEPTEESIILSWLLLILFSIFIAPFFSQKKDEFISSLILVLFVIRVISFTSYIKFAPQPSLFVIYNTVYWCWFLLLLNSKMDVGKILPVHKSNAFIYFISVVSIISIVVVSGVYTGFRLHLSLEDVYDLREEARGYSMPFILSYILSATGNLIPVLVVFFMVKKNKWFVLLLFFIGILNFGIAGQKATIFKIIACVGMMYIPKINLRRYIIPFVVALLAITLLLFVYCDNIAISWVVVRRMFYTPNVIDTMYFDYIMDKGPLFFDSEATGKLAFDISDIYGNGRGGRANNGMFSDAFVNLGTLGIFIMPIVLTLILKLFSHVLKGQNKSVVFFTAMVMATTLTGAFLTRCLFTHGFLLLLIVLYYMPNQDINEDKVKISRINKN